MERAYMLWQSCRHMGRTPSQSCGSGGRGPNRRIRPFSEIQDSPHPDL